MLKRDHSIASVRVMFSTAVYREWQAADGTRRSKHAVIGRVRFCGGRSNGQPTDPHDVEHELDHEPAKAA
jgi:hypothetical protein